MATMSLAEILSTTVEYQHWGLNAITASFFLSILVTSSTAWGLIQQNNTIWQTKKVPALSIIWMTYYAILQLVILIYGLSISSAALMLNGLLFLLYLPILVGLSRYKGYRLVDRSVATILLLGVLVMLTSSNKPWIFLLFAIGGLASAFTQPLEIWRRKSAGGVNRKLVFVLLFGTIVWFFYGLIITDWVLIVINTLATVIFSLTLVLLHHYKR